MSLTLGFALMLIVFILGYDGLRYRNANGVAATVDITPDISVGKAAFQAPEKIVFAGGKDSGPVAFNHDSHTNLDPPNCITCHSRKFRILAIAQRSTTKTDRHSKEQCGACHNGREAFDIKEDCTYCHQ